MSWTVRYSESAYPITPVEPLKATLRSFWNFSVFCLLYIHINNDKFTYDKFKTAKFGFSIFDVVESEFIRYFMSALPLPLLKNWSELYFRSFSLKFE